MNKFLATAALALVASLASIPAQAQIGLNGVQLNGYAWNGLALNGLRLNGTLWNGLRLNGNLWNGVKLNGIKMNGTGTPVLQTSTIFAVTLPEGLVP